MKALLNFMLRFFEAFFGTPEAVYATNQTLAGRGPAEVQVKTANYTVLDGENGNVFSTKGAGGTVVFALPAAVVGLRYSFYVGAVQELRVDPNGTEIMQLPSTGANQAAGAYLTANAIGETLSISCFETGVWSVVCSVGTWTAV